MDLVNSSFRVVNTREIEEYASTGILLEHKKTGCQVYHLSNDDRENLFAFIFRTPPVDNSGVAHILEHAVLSGSRRFTVKDPFITLMKGSVHTFLNALTYPDKTVFPAASIVEKDYFDLLEVYGDAVFFPLLRKEVFHQEGRRIEIDDSGNVYVDGVVYNEMRGNYSDHDSIVGEWSYRSLFPDSPYRFDSGGEPGAIRDLGYETFLDYHKSWYHPSNCLIFLYGNIPTEKSLDFVEGKFLSRFDRKHVDTSVPAQPGLIKPVEMMMTSPLAADDGPHGKTTVTLNWIVGRIEDPYRVLSLEVLAEILLGNPGAPMYKAIQESNLGDDLSPVSGLDTDTKELVFTFGLRGSDPEKSEAFEDLVTGELRKLVSSKVPADVVTGALRRVEFRNREIRGGVPFGLRLLGKTLRGWLHGSEPEATLEFEPWMERLKADVGKGGFFERLISESFIDNRRRSTVIVVPSHDHEKRELSEFEDWKKRFLAQVTDEERAILRRENEAFRSFQEVPDPPEAIDAIPTLAVEDIPDKVEVIDTEYQDLDGVPCYSLDIFTNGIAYIDLVFDIQDISDELVPFFPLFCRAAAGAGLPGVNYDEVARRLSIETGGFVSFLEISSIPTAPVTPGQDGRKSRSFVVFRMKALEANLEKAFAVVSNLMLRADFSDSRRIRDILFEFRNDVKAQILPAGSSFTALRAGSRLSPVLAREEMWKGIDQVLFLYRLADRVDSELPGICEKLDKLRRIVLNRNRLTVSLTSGGDMHGRARELIEAFTAKLTLAPLPETSYPLYSVETGPRLESIVVPSMVGYVSSVFPASSYMSEQYAHEAVVAQALKTGFLWEQVRMKGGAYGVTASLSGGEMLFSLSSYRDPKIGDTLDAYRKGLDSIAKHGISDSDLEKAIIGIAGRELRPLSPGEKGIIGFRRRLYDISDELRQRKRDELLSTSPMQIREAAGRLRNNLESGFSVVMTGSEALEELPERYSGLKEHRIALL